MKTTFIIRRRTPGSSNAWCVLAIQHEDLEPHFLSAAMFLGRARCLAERLAGGARLDWQPGPDGGDVIKSATVIDRTAA